MRTIVMLTALLAAVPGTAAAQNRVLPKLELGAQVSTEASDDWPISWSPRITFNVTPLTAVEVTVDLQHPTTDTFGLRSSGQHASVHLRQALWASGRWQIFGVFGAGIGRTMIDSAPAAFPPVRFSETEPALHVGQAVQVDVARRLSVRADLRLAIHENGGLRGMVGGVVPLGRLPVPGTRQQALAERDSLANGLAIGAATGGVTGGVLFGFMGWALCEDDPCERFALATATFGTVSGAMVGGLVGAAIDGLIKGKPTTVQVVPVVGPSARGGHVTVSWR